MYMRTFCEAGLQHLLRCAHCCSNITLLHVLAQVLKLQTTCYRDSTPILSLYDSAGLGGCEWPR